MDFFAQQEKARRKTKWLVIYFALAVLFIIGLVYLASVLLFFGVEMRYHRGGTGTGGWWHPYLFYISTLITLCIIICGSLTKTSELSAGGSAVAESLGGELINPSTTDPDERRLMNVVEEMAIASGVAVPQVYVLYDEKGINAFAAGHTTSDAVVAVTRGCLKLLSRDELQGVIGHEFSHILNGDMRLNIRLMGIVFGILCMASIGRVLINTRTSSRDRNPLPLAGLLLLVAGSIGVFFGRLIQAAVSRQREFLADACSVQFTRNPAGLSGALQKIGGYGFGSLMVSENASEAAHMFFGSAIPRPAFNPMATHPPLQERIQAIDPTWNGTFRKVNLDEIRQEDPKHPAQPRPIFQDGKLIAILGAATAAQPPPKAPPILRHMGTPTTAHLRYADTLRNSIPENLKLAARDPMGAAAMIYGVLLASHEDEQETILSWLEQNISGAMRQETERLLPDVDSVAHHAKLPLVDLALPALRNFSGAQYEQFNAAVEALVECDGKIDLFGYVLQKVLLRHLDSHFHETRRQIVQYYALKPLADECSVLLSALAHVGSNDAGECEAAFQDGAAALAYAEVPLSYCPAEQCDFPQLDAALDKLNQAVPQIKKNVLNACAAVVASDGVIQEQEAELLRAIAATLDCPLPPFVQPEETGAAEPEGIPPRIGETAN